MEYTETLLVASNEVALEVNAEKRVCVCVCVCLMHGMQVKVVTKIDSK